MGAMSSERLGPANDVVREMRSRGCPARPDLTVAPRGRKQLQRKQQSVDDAESEAHFNDTEYVNDCGYDTLGIFYIAY